ncbi:MAG: uroporphyrinogen-III synthase, partial [Sulfurimonas sp.]
MSKNIYLFATSKNKYANSIKSLDVRYLKPEIDFSKYDYLIITSKQTVKALEQYKKEDYIN